MRDLSTSEGRAEGRFRAGDPLRAIAALSVVLYHAAYLSLTLNGLSPTAFDAYGAAGTVLHALDLGLYIFFVLSGYLIARPFVRAYVEGTPGPDWRGYGRNRLLRIVPAFWVVYTAMLLIWGTRGDSAGEILSVYGFAQIWNQGQTALYVGPAWTLAVELSFYLLVPFVTLAAARLTPAAWDASRRLRAVVVACVAVALASVALRQFGPETIAFRGSFPALAFAFVPGVLLAAAELRARPLVDSGRARILSLVSLVISAAAFAAAASVSTELVSFDPRIPASRTVLATIGAGGLLAAALLREWGGRRPVRLLDNRVLVTLGLWSYSIYLIHQGFIALGAGWLGDAGGPRGSLLLAVATAVPIVVALAATSFHVVERPALERRVPWRRGVARPRVVRDARAVPAEATAE